MNQALKTGHTGLDKQLARWYPLIDHPVQLSLVGAVDRGVRFPLVPAGRRSGKTERFKRFIVKKANAISGMYFAAAPTHDQAKKIFWDDLKALSLSCMHRKPPSETNRIIYLPNDSEIHVFGLDKPERIDGIPWKGGGVDEIADTKEGGWEENILPALNTVDPRTPDYLAWCWLLGVPDGLNFYYDLCERAKTGNDSNFEVFHWKSAEILPANVIESMQRAMGARQFRQEFEASFETASGRIYDEYSSDNTTNELIKPHEQLMWHHDFNFTPMSSGVGVRRGNAFYVLDEIVLTSAVARQSAVEFIDRFKDHKNRTIIVYGDPAGRAGEKHGHASDYTDIEGVLKSNNWTVIRKVKNAAPAIRDRQNAVRAKIRNAKGEISLFINPAKAPYAHKGLSIVQFMKGSTYQEEVSDYQHITTAIGYCIDYEWPAVGKKMQPKIEPLPIANHYGRPGA